MKPLFILTLTLACSSASTAIAQQNEGFKRVDGVYQIYGGSLGDRTEPTAKDKKILFAISGTAAKDIFDAIGPDRKDPCTEGSGTRVRAKDKDHLVCTRTKKGEYSCGFGFDLMNGKSIGGSIC